MKKILFLLLVLFTSFYSTAQRLDMFGSSASETKNKYSRRIPYIGVKNYFGYIKADSVSIAQRNSRECFYLYFYLTDTLPEIGLRIITPVSPLIMPDKGDFTSADYFVNEKDKENTFDAWLALDRADNIYAGKNQEQGELNWHQLANDDNSNELLNPSNAVVRISNKQQSILPGLYRIAISTMKDNKIKGGFLIQVGSVIKLHGLKLSPYVEEVIN